jgi:DNA/RNA-binding domain of Phe-tRNA-synthetase-like protein
MHFSHAPEIWRNFPELVPGVLAADGITRDASVAAPVARFLAAAERRLATGPEGEFPEIQAWRRAFTRTGLEPTRYRSAAEALLRRYRKEQALPQIHPLIDLCNAISLAFAIPVAVFDRSRIADFVEVRYADGSERFLSFAGEEERPEPREVAFVDGEARAHARRWTHRQSAYSAVRAETSEVLIVAEAMHETGLADVQRLTEEVAEAIASAWQTSPTLAVLSEASARFAS